MVFVPSNPREILDDIVEVLFGGFGEKVLVKHLMVEALETGPLEIVGSERRGGGTNSRGSFLFLVEGNSGGGWAVGLHFL